MKRRSLLSSLVLVSTVVAQPSLVGVSPAPRGGTQSGVFSIETMPFASSSLANVNTPALSGLAIQPGTAELFASGGGRSNGTLFRIDRQTGALSTVGATGFARVPGLAFAPDGTLFGTTETAAMNGVDTLIRIDPATGAGTVVGAMGIADVGGIAFNPQNSAPYAITTEMPPVLYAFDPATGATTLEGTVTGITGDRVVGLAIDCAGRAWGSTTSGDIYRISLASYDANLIGSAANAGVSDIAALREPNISATCGTAGGSICNSTMPRIGTVWEICEADLQCRDNRFMLIGGCNAAGIPIRVVECPSCTGCRLHVLPIFTSVAWSYGLTLPVPNNPGLVGLNICVQSACVDAMAGCMCLSNTISATIR